jgi:ABC-type Mn2+/Zn2+ transport system permease subunit
MIALLAPLLADEVSWGDRLDLFRWAILATLVAGLVCPLVGCLLYLRRTSFYGITLPQFATAGVVFGFVVLPWWVEAIGLGGLSADEALADVHAALNYHLAWAALFTFGGLAMLVFLGRRGGSEIGRVAAAFALANAATYLFGRMSPGGKAFVDELLSGEVLGVGVHEFEVLSGFYALVLAALLVWHRDLLLVSFDPDMARVLAKRVALFELLATALTGLTVSVGAMIFGPTLLFGLLVIPPLAARGLAASMGSYYAWSAAFGLASAVGGAWASFEFDLPWGAAVVATSALWLGIPPIVRGLASRQRSRT